MANTPLDKLLSAVLTKQQEGTSLKKIDELRVRDILSARSTITSEEQQLLLRSPTARRQLYFINDVMRAEQLAHWQQSDVQNTIQLQAAAQSYPEQQPICIDSNPNFVLTLFPPEGNNDSWIIHLQVTLDLLTEIKGVRLLDSSGREWLSGIPDTDGEISQPWKYTEEPLSVLQKYHLSIEPY